jgi:hypothetical protein
MSWALAIIHMCIMQQPQQHRCQHCSAYGMQPHGMAIRQNTCKTMASRAACCPQFTKASFTLLSFNPHRSCQASAYAAAVSLLLLCCCAAVLSCCILHTTPFRPGTILAWPGRWPVLMCAKSAYTASVSLLLLTMLLCCLAASLTLPPA